MAENTLPKKNVAHTFYVALVATASRPDLQANPTLAAGDVQASTDGGAFGNLTTLPVVTPASGVAVKVDLSAAEMNGDNVTVKFIDAAGAEWDDLLVEIRPAVRKVEDLAWPTTTGRSLDVAATGEAGLDFGNAVGSITGGELGVGAFAASAITAAAIAANAIGASELATDAIGDAQIATGAIAATAFAAGAINAAATATDYLAEIRVEAAGALSDIFLDNLFAAAEADEAVDNSYWAKMVSATGDASTFTPGDESLEALRTQGDAAWITAVGFSTITTAQVNTEVDNALDTAIPVSPTADSINERVKTMDAGVILAAAEDVYHADIRLTIDEANTRDEYTATWFKNGARITSGITVPTIQVVKRADGTDLVASTAMTQIGSTGSYKYDEATNRTTAGEAALAIVAATIDTGGRSFAAVVTRDSSA